MIDLRFAEASELGRDLARLRLTGSGEASFRELEVAIYLWALDRAGSMRAAARALGISRTTFVDRCHRHGIVPVKVEET